MTEQPSWLEITFAFMYYMKVLSQLCMHACTNNVCEVFHVLNL